MFYMCDSSNCTHAELPRCWSSSISAVHVGGTWGAIRREKFPQTWYSLHSGVNSTIDNLRFLWERHWKRWENSGEISPFLFARLIRSADPLRSKRRSRCQFYRGAFTRPCHWRIINFALSTQLRWQRINPRAVPPTVDGCGNECFSEEGTSSSPKYRPAYQSTGSEHESDINYLEYAENAFFRFRLPRAGQSARGFCSRVCCLRPLLSQADAPTFFDPSFSLPQVLSLLRGWIIKSSLRDSQERGARAGHEERMIAITSTRKVITNAPPVASRCAELHEPL